MWHPSLLTVICIRYVSMYIIPACKNSELGQFTLVGILNTVYEFIVMDKLCGVGKWRVSTRRENYSKGYQGITIVMISVL